MSGGQDIRIGVIAKRARARDGTVFRTSRLNDDGVAEKVRSRSFLKDVSADGAERDVSFVGNVADDFRVVFFVAANGAGMFFSVAGIGIDVGTVNGGLFAFRVVAVFAGADNGRQMLTVAAGHDRFRQVVIADVGAVFDVYVSAKGAGGRIEVGRHAGGFGVDGFAVFMFAVNVVVTQFLLFADGTLFDDGIAERAAVAVYVTIDGGKLVFSEVGIVFGGDDVATNGAIVFGIAVRATVSVLVTGSEGVRRKFAAIDGIGISAEGANVNGMRADLAGSVDLFRDFVFMIAIILVAADDLRFRYVDIFCGARGKNA